MGYYTAYYEYNLSLFFLDVSMEGSQRIESLYTHSCSQLAVSTYLFYDCSRDRLKYSKGGDENLV
jgi:hypothetical protein